MSAGALNTRKDWKRLVDELEDEVRKWKVLDYEIPTKYKVIAQAAASRTVPAVTVRYTQGGKSQPFTCQRFPTAEQNLAAIIDIVAAVRKAYQRGLVGLMAEVSAHAKALPAPKTPYEVLGIKPDATEAEAKAAWRAALLRAHPDKGGSREAYDAVMDAGRTLGVTD